jgi:hypothetical protein
MEKGIQNNKPKTSERLETMEKAVISLSQANLGMAQQIENIRRVTVDLAEKLEAVFYLTENNIQPTEKNVEKHLTEVKTQELKASVDQGLANGEIKKAKVVGNNGFVVIKETDKESNEVTQPRAQVAVAFMPDDVKNDFLGKKVGDKIEKEDVIIEILEVYDLVKDLNNPEGE